MTVYDVMEKVEATQPMRITDKVRGTVRGGAHSLNEMLDDAILSLKVDMIRTESGVIVVEVKSE